MSPDDAYQVYRTRQTALLTNRIRLPKLHWIGSKSLPNDEAAARVNGMPNLQTVLGYVESTRDGYFSRVGNYLTRCLRETWLPLSVRIRE